MVPDELANLRRSYSDGSLSEDSLAPSPLEQFRAWFDDACASPAVVEPNAMVLSTVDAAGAPSSRTVLLKGLDGEGFRFFTNLGSRKGQDVLSNPAVALLFAWHAMERQVAVRGLVVALGRDEVGDYFRSRPYASRIGAWTSRQSEVLDGREALEAREAALRQQHPDTGSADDVPLPEFWGGFVVRPVEVELWQGRPSRLHDRLIYVRPTDGPGRLDTATDWRIERRSP